MMNDNQLLLKDRIDKIREVINKYGEENFYISFSGGKDSTVLSALVDMAIPDNKIPRVYANTGIEYKLILQFVKKLKEKEHPWELVILEPSVPIKPMLEKEGYPFKSKEHSACVNSYQQGNKNGRWITRYLNRGGRYGCPQKLKYQFTEDFKLKVSDKCCDRLKKDVLHEYQKANEKKYGIVGIIKAEGGRRTGAKCLAFEGKKLKNFQPLVPITKEWEEWFIDKYNVDISDIYKPPYNFRRTGCKGCPFAPDIKEELDTLEKFFPAERKQCEIIWKPVYEEYRRIDYRLKKKDQFHQMTIEDYMKENYIE